METIFRLFYPRLTRYAQHYLADPDAAQDIVQELFVYLWERRGNIRCVSLSALLLVSVRNRCLNYIEHQNYIGRYLDHMPHSEVEHLYATNLSISANSANSADPTSVDGSVLQQLLNTVLNNLPDRQQEAYRYVRLNDCTLQSAAEEMNISISAVAKLVNKASEKVKAYIQKHYPTDF
ncbi:sigma-70 family RNA polymerase sigma factor [Prevotella sp.]|uniref:sigma-70 family RNA polymerase sigma factor n=1 Tax=Prevotella sp. TaxID=59823 RepID=UPI0040253936